MHDGPEDSGTRDPKVMYIRDIEAARRRWWGKDLLLLLLHGARLRGRGCVIRRGEVFIGLRAGPLGHPRPARKSGKEWE